MTHCIIPILITNPFRVSMFEPCRKTKWLAAYLLACAIFLSACEGSMNTVEIQVVMTTLHPLSLTGGQEK